MMKIPSYIIQSTQSIQTLNANIDKAIAEGKWYSLLMHGVNETNPETANNNINKDVCEAHFSYIGSKQEVWAGSMTEVIQYIKERNTANITINWIRENAMNLSLTDTLDDARFDFPLTYKVNVPSHWDSVKVTQNYNSVTVATQMVGDKNYVYITFSSR
jgi:chitin deacetylase